MRRDAKPAKAKGGAKPPVARKSQKSGSGIRDLEKRLAEALGQLETRTRELADAQEQQGATSEILRVISSSPTDVQPVFDTIVQSAARLCHAANAGVFLTDGRTLDLPANYGSSSPEVLATIRAQYPRPLDRETTAGVAILTRSVVHVPDVEAPSAAEVYTRRIGRLLGVRSMVAVPLTRKGEVVGAINLSRLEPGRFSDMEVELLKTFADQAVIAIENVRLFNETKEALERQTATSEILQVIARSPTDLQPVLDALVESVGRLCEAADTFLLLVAGDQLRVAALHPSVEGGVISNPIQRGWVAGRAVMERRTVHVEDLANAQSEFPVGSEIAVRLGHRTALAMPLLRKGVPIGALFLRRRQVRRFSDKQIALLQTFADQAVIAIENVRLFTELQEKNRALTEAHTRVTESLEQQMATAEVLRVISGSPTDLQPVFDAMLQSAVRLLGGFGGAILLYDGSALHLGAVMGGRPQSGAEDWFRSIYPIPLDPDTPIGSAILERRMIQLPDTEESASQITREVARGFQFRALVTVPMLREGSAIGTISITRAAPGEFSERQVEVLQTFADQAVIAIENVRLFKELEASNREIADKSRQLEVASQHKSEFLANMSHELRTPLNAIIGFSEVLTERMFGELNEKQEEYLTDIHASGTHLLSLINDILDLSKIEAGRMELELTDFDLPTALDNALTLVRERAGRRGIALEKSVDGRLGQVRADERKIRQVVLNLLSNAIKFTPEGGQIGVAAVSKDGSVEVSVSDTGVGIAAGDQEAVFEEFRQVGTSAAKQEGTGLGLALCRKFVELHGGKIWVQSEVGVGSTFTFSIPLRHGE
jgi:two-component system, NtrC family, sensor kinase